MWNICLTQLFPDFTQPADTVVSRICSLTHNCRASAGGDQLSVSYKQLEGAASQWNCTPPPPATRLSSVYCEYWAWQVLCPLKSGSLPIFNSLTLDTHSKLITKLVTITSPQIDWMYPVQSIPSPCFNTSINFQKTHQLFQIYSYLLRTTQ